MKNKIILAFVILISGGFVFGQDSWTKISSDSISVSQNLYDVHFVDSKYGWACGNGGSIIYTDNSGTKWTTQLTGASYFLEMMFVDNNTGYAVKRGGEMYKTINKGSSWNTVGNASHLCYGLHFVNADTGWVSGVYDGNGKISRTINGGTIWSNQNYTGNTIFDIHFVETDTGWVGWGCGKDGRVIRTTDKGASWNNQSSGVSNILYSVFFVNSDSGWIAGWGGVVLRTADGGENWYDTEVCSENLNDVYFKDSKNGWVVGDNGTIFATTDGGETWTAENSNVNVHLWGITFNADTGWCVGNNATILKYVNESPEITLSSDSVNIGRVDIDLSDDGLFTIRNTGVDTLFISSITSDDNNFTLSDSSGTILKDDSLVVTVTFSPLSVGYDTAVITIVSNDPDEDTVSVTAIGYGVAVPVTAALPDTTVSKGVEFFLPVTISNVQSIDSIMSYQFKLGFNSSLIEFTDYDTTGTLSCNFSFNYNNSIPDTLILSAAACTYPIKSNGILLKLGFKLKQAFTYYDTAYLNFSDFMFNENTPDDSTVNCIVTVDSCIYGDVSLNGEITAYDAALALGYTIGEEPQSGAAETAADVSGNSMVSAYDASLILRYVVGVITEFPVGSDKFMPKTELKNAGLSVNFEYGENNTVECLIILNDAENVYSSELEINFTNMELLGIEKTEATKEHLIAEKSTDCNIEIALAGTDPVKIGSGIIRLRFGLLNGGPSFRISRAVLNETEVTVTNIEETVLPRTFNLSQNYPNPFNPETTIKYGLPESADVILKIYNMLGQEVKTLVNSRQKAGYYNVKWNGTNDLGLKVSSGVYVYRIKAGKFIRSKKMVYLR